MSLHLNESVLKTTLEIVLPTRLSPEEEEHFLGMLSRASTIYNFQWSERVLIRLLLGRDLRPLTPNASESDDDYKLMTGLAAKVRYQSYAATMRSLGQIELPEERWRNGSGFINDTIETRKPTLDRWLSLLRQGFHIGDSINLEGPLNPGILTGIDQRCMVELCTGSNKLKIAPERLKNPRL